MRWYSLALLICLVPFLSVIATSSAMDMEHCGWPSICSPGDDDLGTKTYNATFSTYVDWIPTSGIPSDICGLNWYVYYDSSHINAEAFSKLVFDPDMGSRCVIDYASSVPGCTQCDRELDCIIWDLYEDAFVMNVSATTQEALRSL